MKPVVIAASIGMSLVLPLAYSQAVAKQFSRWREEQAQIVVPALWRYEMLSTLRRAVAGRLLTNETAQKALQSLRDLALEEYALEADREPAILSWAERIGQRLAYDSVYLALAEQLGAEFWTADRHLADAAIRAGADWVRLPSEQESTT